MWQAINESLSHLCSSPFWDTNVTWDSPDPDFTLCFEKTVLSWVPCLFLWLLLPLEIYCLKHTHAYNIPFNLYNITKLVLIAILATTVIMDIVSCFLLDDEPHPPIDIYSSVIKFSSFCLFFVLTYYNIRCGIRSSGVLFLFSFLLALFGAAQFRSELRSRHNLVDSPTKSHDMLHFVSYMIYYPLVLVVLVLNCFADACPVIQLLPIEENECPENQSSFLSQIFIAWFDVFVWKGHKKPLTDADLWSLEYDLKAAQITRKFESKWYPTLERLRRETANERTHVQYENQELLGRVNITQKIQKDVKEASVVRPLFQAFGVRFMFGVALKIIQDILVFVSPQILKAIIGFVEDENEYSWRGYFYAITLLTVTTLRTLLTSQYSRITFRTGLEIKTALMLTIYKKVLKISNRSRRGFTVGQIVNLVSVDAHRFVDLMEVIEVVWSTPLQISLAVYFLWNILGPSVLAGLAVMILLIPVNAFIGSKVEKYQIEQMKNKDNRLKRMNEILSGIKVLKLYAWEPSFEKHIVRIRDREVRNLRKTVYMNVAMSFIWTCTPFLVTLVTFAVYVLSSDEHLLDAKTAFVSLSLFNTLRVPLALLPWFITNFIQTTVSVKRINTFLNSEELDSDAVSHDGRVEPIVINNGQFSWEGYEGSSMLSNINLNVKPGSLIAVVGPVGSGKSSLLSAILGEMYKQSGYVNTTGSLAYVPQHAWLQNASLKDNITLGDTSRDSFYREVIKSCALIPDLRTLPGGDQTEIGEQGVNLSGGQKQRISLARAVFIQADIYLLDDPLSAVDSHVGKNIFQNVIGPNGLLKEKTRVFVTHHVTYLPQVDFIVVLKNGVISESGTYVELVEKKGDFADFLATYSKDDQNDDYDDDDAEDSQTTPDNIVQLGSRKSSDGASFQHIIRRMSESSPVILPVILEGVGQKLIESEKTETGHVEWVVYSFYLSAVGPFLVVMTLIMNVLVQAFSIASNYWLSVWTSDTSAVMDGHQNILKRNQYLVVYGFLGLGLATAIVLMTLFLSFGTLKAARSLHNNLLKVVMRWPMSVFDTMPIGRILNRFSSDLEVIDNDYQHFFLNVLQLGSDVISILLVISYSTPLFMTVILPVGVLYYFVQRFYVSTARQLKRLEFVSKSPICSYFGETVSGVQSIRAYGLQKKFIKTAENKIDYNMKSFFSGAASNWWLIVRLGSVGNLITFFAALFAVLARNTLSTGLVGLSVNYALEIPETLYWLVRMVTELETNIVSVERIKEYSEIKQEASWEKPDENIPPNWPENGNILFSNFEVRYREGMDTVLKNVTFHVKGGEKVGIAGRTGAGKSSLTLSLFRILEAAGGNIVIDNVDISKIGLHLLRKRLTIIPQDPVLFSWSLRRNLDPTEIYTDEKIWKALELSHLKAYVSGVDLGLQHEVSEGGANFSVGQRQLICLARALLRKTKILILDEATAAIDLETDDVIQATIRKEFKDCTVLTIAHRLNTIMDYDRVIVLERGRIVEFDSPKELLKSKRSVFYGMAVDAGLI